MYMEADTHTPVWPWQRTDIDRRVWYSENRSIILDTLQNPIPKVLLRRNDMSAEVMNPMNSNSSWLSFDKGGGIFETAELLVRYIGDRVENFPF